jgi:hypothetical protein
MTSKYVLVPQHQFNKWQEKSISPENVEEIHKINPKSEKEFSESPLKDHTSISQPLISPPPPGKPPRVKTKVEINVKRLWKSW